VSKLSWHKKSSSNQTTLDKLSENNGSLTFSGNPVGITPTNKGVLDGLSDVNGALVYNGAQLGTTTATGSIPTGVLINRSTINKFDRSVNTGNSNPLISDYIPVKEGWTYSFSGNVNRTYTVYDSTQTAITTSTAQTAKIPTGGRYIKVTIYGGQSTLDTFMVNEGTYIPSSFIPFSIQTFSPDNIYGMFKSKWYGKSWWVLGDSISTGNGDGWTNNAYATKPYHYKISLDRNITVQNDAVSGYTISNIYNNKVTAMPPTAYAPDLITIMAGTNDHGFNTTIGAITDTPATSGSFYAVYKQLIETLITNYPNASIGLITPIQRNGSTNGNNANAVGKTLRDYCDAVVALGKNYSLPVLDWYYSLGFSPYNTTQLNNFYCGSPSDGTHPNDKGHTIMAGKVGNFIESL
jgi:lysophospholipase L1-like esterase